MPDRDDGTNAVLHTPRLRLEPFADRHFDGLFALNSDPVVMRYLGAPDTAESVRASIARVEALWAERGFSWWAILPAGSDEIVGAGCVQHIENDPANPIEVGWRLRPADWGKGYATEAARAMLAFGFARTDAARLYAVADPANAASIGVMRRLGMTDLGLRRYYGADCATYCLERPPAET